MCVVQCNYIARCKEACLEGDNVCCFEGGFLVKLMSKARDAESLCHELECGGC